MTRRLEIEAFSSTDGGDADDVLCAAGFVSRRLKSHNMMNPKIVAHPKIDGPQKRPQLIGTLCKINFFLKVQALLHSFTSGHILDVTHKF